MRSVLALSALMATSALAKPLQHQHAHDKRQVVVVTDVEVAYVTQWVTAGVTDVAATSTSSDVATSTADSDASSVAEDWGFGWWTRRSTTTTATATSTSTSTRSKTTKSSSSKVSTTSVVVVSSATSTPAATSSTTLLTVVSSVPATSSTPVASSTTVATSTAAAATGYAALALAHHNVHRANHSAPAATWNTTLASIALEIANSCSYAHNTAAGGGGYGQNIAAGAPASQVTSVISDLFYNGEVNWFTGYGEANPDMTNFEHWGHFSQIVWKASTSVGCATVDCTASGLSGVSSDVPPYFTVCNYYPAGNMGGEYGVNIGDSLDEPTVVGTDSV